MKKNLVKKGLSLFASSVLTAGALVGFAAPAHAAELKIEPSAGTIWAVGSADAFTVKVSFNSGYSSSGVTDKVKFVLTQGGIGGFRVNADASATLTSVDDSTDVTTSAVAANDSDLKAVKAAADAAVSFLGVGINSASTSTTYTVGVQAWVDNDGDNVIDSGEWVSNSETITFLKYSAITYDADLEDPILGDTTATVYVTSDTINIQQLEKTAASSSQFVARFYDGTSFEENVLLDWNATYSYLEATTSATYTALSGGDTVKVEIFTAAEADAGSDADTVYGDAAYATAVETRIEAVATATVSANTAVSTVDGLDTTATSSNAATIRSGSGTVVVYSKVTYVAGYSSAAVTFTLNEDGANTLDSGAVITAGGKTLKNTNAGTVQTVYPVITADADGYAYLTLTYTGLEDGDIIEVDSSAQGFSGTQLTLTAADATPSDISNTDAIGTNDESAQLVYAVGSAVSLNYAVVDQFGKLFTGAGASVTVSDGSKSASASVVNGVATVTLTAYTAATTKTMSPTLYLNGTDKSITEPTTSVKIGTVTAPAAVTATGDAGTTSASTVSALNLETPGNADQRKGDNAVDVTASSNSTISGTVTDSNLDTTVASVTVSAPGLMFEADGVWAMNSITVQTTSSGTYAVEAYSTLAGKHVITVTSGSATKTEEIWWPEADDNAGKTLTLTGPDYVQAGSTLQVVAKVVDKFGNPINTVSTTASANDEASELGADFAISYTGPGLLVGSIPTETDATGVAMLNYLLGINDKGTITITAKYDANGDADYTDTGDLVVVKTVTIGTAPVAPSAGTVNVGSFNGKLVVYAKNLDGAKISWKVGGKWGTAVAVGNTLNRFDRVTPRKGVTVSVDIYVNGVKTLTKSVVTR